MTSRQFHTSHSFNFEIRPFSVDSLTIRETGKPFIAMLQGKPEDILKDVDLLGLVFTHMSKKDRRLYGGSVVLFIDFVMKHPEDMKWLRSRLDNSVEPFGSWSETIFSAADSDDKLH